MFWEERKILVTSIFPKSFEKPFSPWIIKIQVELKLEKPFTPVVSLKLEVSTDQDQTEQKYS